MQVAYEVLLFECASFLICTVFIVEEALSLKRMITAHSKAPGMCNRRISETESRIVTRNMRNKFLESNLVIFGSLSLK